MIRRSALDRLDWQAPLFAARLNRLALMRLGAPAPTGPALRVQRNHAFEGVASVLAPFFEFAGFALRPVLGDYDDSLSLPEEPYAAAVVWLDFARYSRLDDDQLVAWLLERLDVLRANAGGPLVVANSPDVGPRAEMLNAALEAWAARTAGAALLRLDRMARDLGDVALAEHRAAVTGTRYADPLCLEAARALVFEVLGAFHADPVKALAVDLDNTLYAGVLGEDGAEGVRLTEGHAELQQEIARLAETGVLVSILSRNEAADVQALFERRQDFPLRPEHVASWQVSWGEKSDALAAAAAGFNIAPESFLFIDDNVGELAQTSIVYAGLRLLHAGERGEDTARALAKHPGLPRDGLAFAGRSADLGANVQRAALAQEAVDSESYLRALKVELLFALDPAEDRGRLAEISRKTNQFNLALRRLDEVEVDRYLSLPDRCVVHVRLADRLADSGSVAALFGRREEGALIVDELCISCRALGRRLEDLMVAEAVRHAARRLGVNRIGFEYRRGPRNQPALSWLERFLGVGATEDAGRLEAGLDRFAAVPQTGVEVNWIS